MKKSLGVSMIELMMVVTIIGVLAGIAVPRYTASQAKGRTLEAKIKLANLYTKESTFYTAHRTYVSCLNFIGFNPSKDYSERYYAIGFAENNATGNKKAIDNNVLHSNCNNAQVWIEASPPIPPGKAIYFYTAKKNGVTKHGDLLTASLFTKSSGNYVDRVSDDGQKFQAIAAGKVALIPGYGLDAWVIDNNKKLKQQRVGY